MKKKDFTSSTSSDTVCFSEMAATVFCSVALQRTQDANPTARKRTNLMFAAFEFNIDFQTWRFEKSREMKILFLHAF